MIARKCLVSAAGVGFLRMALGLALLLTQLPSPTQAQHASALAQPANKLSPELQSALAAAQPNDTVPVIVHMQPAPERQQKFEAMRAAAQSSPNADTLKNQRAQFVTALQQQAAQSQQATLLFLAQNNAIQTKPFWIFNGIATRATPALITQLAQRNDISQIRLDRWAQRIEDVPTPLVLPQAPTSTVQLLPTPLLTHTLDNALADPMPPPEPGNTTWGIGKIRADQVWNGLGVRGAGVVVANVDSGVDWQHPALRNQYRGGIGPVVDHVHNWFDASDEAATIPYDQNGHGTHTMGTMVGANGIGVAPAAKWMACKGLVRDGYGYDSWLHACFQFLLAPAGDARFAPDIINNSWGNTDGKSTEYENDVDALNAAGIFVVFSNGNSGPKPETAGSPAALPRALSVGATDIDDEIAYFSSRGPSPYDGEVKPNLSAPGVKVLSSMPGGIYKLYSGTSMAAPHVAGTAALLMSADPSLKAGDVLNALKATAIPLSTTIPNNDSGFGRIDAYSATLSVLRTGVLVGQVRDANGTPIPNAAVQAFGKSNPVQATGNADVNGNYSLPIPFGFYTATASAFGFGVQTLGPRLVVTGNSVSLSFVLMELPTGVVRGRVRDAVTGNVITATVSALGTPKFALSNNSCPPCRYAIDLPTGVYTLEARATGYGVLTQTVALIEGSVVDADFALSPTQRIALVDSGAWYYASEASYYRQALDDLHLAYDEIRIKQVLRDTPSITTLLKYDTVIWSSPYDSPGLIGASDVLSRYMAAGKNLFLSGQDIALFDGGGFSFAGYFEKINAYLRRFDVESRDVFGKANTLLAGKAISIAGGDGADNQYQPDSVMLSNRDKSGFIAFYDAAATGTGTYDEGAGVFTALCQKHKAAFLGFGFEAISTRQDRTDVMQRVLNAFAAPRQTLGVELVSQDSFFTGIGVGAAGSVVTHVLRLRNVGEAGATEKFSVTLAGNAWQSALSQSAFTLKPCATALLTLTVQIPPTATLNLRDTVTLTVALARDSHIADAEAIHTKTPASMLLVDDERFTVSEDKYTAALAAHGNTSLDHWDTRMGVGIASSPPISVLRNYGTVIWFNGYDWYDPITEREQAVLQTYLEGGGRLFFTSQAALQFTNGNYFDKHYLGVASLDYDDVISDVVGVPGNGWTDGFAPTSLLPFPYNWNLGTAVQPMPDAQVFLRSNSGQPAALSKAGANGRWRTAFMPFAFEVLTDTAQLDLMNRVVGGLSFLGDSSVVAEKTSVVRGERVRYTITLKADDFVSVLPTQTVAISIPLSASLVVVSSTLPNASANNAGSWVGTLLPKQMRTWTFDALVQSDANDYAPLTATLRVCAQSQHLCWTRDTAVRVGAPVLNIVFDTPNAVKWSSATPMTLHVKNTSAVAVPFTLTLAVPSGLTMATTPLFVSTLSVNEQTKIRWQQVVPANAELSMSYVLSMPKFLPDTPFAFYNTARIDTTTGTAQQAALWLAPEMKRFWFPYVWR